MVVTARRAERLLRCLAAVERETPSSLPVEVIVVLNAAEPELRAAVRDEVDGAEVVESEIPLGFAGAVNLGARTARGELLHVLHDDTEVRPGWLDALIECLDAHPAAGAVGSALVDEAGTLQAAGSVLWRDGRTASWLGESPEAFPVDYVTSASLLVRGDAWNAIGGFDEDFHPAYYVDVDFALALRREGLAVLCEPRSHVVHERGGSANRAFREFLSTRNRERFVAKWASELERYEPYGEDAESLARAQRAAMQRAASLPGTLRVPDRPAVASPVHETRAERLAREHGQLRRDLDIKDEYVRTLEGKVDEHEASLLAARAALEASEADHAWLIDERERLLEARDRMLEELRWLRERERALAAIEAGGWWRLRTRLLPLLHAATRARGLTRRAGSSRTG